MVRPRDHEVEVEIQSILLTAEAGCLVVEASATGTRGGDEELDVDSSQTSIDGIPLRHCAAEAVIDPIDFRQSPVARQSEDATFLYK